MYARYADIVKSAKLIELYRNYVQEWDDLDGVFEADLPRWRQQKAGQT
jgi:hypothetical protein